MGIGYLIDAAILSIYSYAGATPAPVGPAFGMTGLLSLAVFITLFEIRRNDERLDDRVILPQLLVGIAIMLTFLYVAPEVGCVFLCDLFLVFAFGALQANWRQMTVALIVMTIGLAYLFLGTDKSIQMPHTTGYERFASLLVFTLTIGRCTFIGVFSNRLRTIIHKRSLELKEANRRIEELAKLDELTGAHNRRCIMQILQSEIQNTRLGNQSCAVALIDLDWFKQVNDRFGHLAGDEVLRTFVITIFANIRSIDKIGRYGGEEFLLILPETTDSAARRTLERLRSIIADLDWSAISPGVAVTMSAGITMMRPDDTAESILSRADSVLYHAKNLGRNRIMEI